MEQIIQNTCNVPLYSNISKNLSLDNLILSKEKKQIIERFISERKLLNTKLPHILNINTFYHLFDSSISQCIATERHCPVIELNLFALIDDNYSNILWSVERLKNYLLSQSEIVVLIKVEELLEHKNTTILLQILKHSLENLENCIIIEHSPSNISIFNRPDFSINEFVLEDEEQQYLLRSFLQPLELDVSFDYAKFQFDFYTSYDYQLAVITEIVKKAILLQGRKKVTHDDFYHIANYIVSLYKED